MYIQRHGESEANAKKIYSGLKYDPSLTEYGRKQIESYLDFYSGLDLKTVITSPSKRAIQTAEIIAHHLALPITVDKALHEVDMGDLEFKQQDDEDNFNNYTSVITNWLGGDKSMKFINGESYIDVKERIDHVTKNYLVDNNILLVAHATFFACLMADKVKFKESIYELFLPRAGRGKYENGKWIMIDKRKD